MARGYKDKKRPAHVDPWRNVRKFGLYLLGVGKTWKVETAPDEISLLECWLWLQAEEARRDTGTVRRWWWSETGSRQQEVGLSGQTVKSYIWRQNELVSITGVPLAPIWVLRMKAETS